MKYEVTINGKFVVVKNLEKGNTVKYDGNKLKDYKYVERYVPVGHVIAIQAFFANQVF